MSHFLCPLKTPEKQKTKNVQILFLNCSLKLNSCIDNKLKSQKQKRQIDIKAKLSIILKSLAMTRHILFIRIKWTFSNWQKLDFCMSIWSIYAG